MTKESQKIEIDVTDSAMAEGSINEETLRSFAELVVDAADSDAKIEAFQNAIGAGVDPYLVGGMAEEIRDERRAEKDEARGDVAKERARLDNIIDQATSEFGSNPAEKDEKVWFRNALMTKKDAIRAREDDPAGH